MPVRRKGLQQPGREGQVQRLKEDRRIYDRWYQYLHLEWGCTHSQSPVHDIPRTNPETDGVCVGL